MERSFESESQRRVNRGAGVGSPAGRYGAGTLRVICNMTAAQPDALHAHFIETCLPLEYSGPGSIDEDYVRKVLHQMRAAAHADYSLLAIFGMSKAALTRLLSDARDVFSREDNVLHVDIPPAVRTSQLMSLEH
jgi:hypothetical protein